MTNTSYSDQTTSTSKKSYAVLGATGATGQQLVKILLQRGDVHLHLYARSEQKLIAQNPQLANHPSVTLHIGTISDAPFLAGCVRQCSVIFSVVAINGSVPGVDIAERTAGNVVSALRVLRDENKQKGNTEWKCPTVVVLTAAPLNEELVKDEPRAVRWMVETAIRYVYDDHRKAMRYYRVENPWVPMIQAQPGMLLDGEPTKGKMLVVKEGPLPPMTYGDLARGMIEMADNSSQWTGQDAGIRAEEDPGFSFALLKHMVVNMFTNIIPGIVYSLFPWFYWLTHRS